MKTQRLWVCLRCLISVLGISAGIFAALPASAQTQLPTSVSEAVGSPWKAMKAGSFEPTSFSASRQCDLAARQSTTDALTGSHCLRFGSMLENFQCKSVQVGDGVVHDFMSYRKGERAFISNGVLKEHGQDTSALLCNLGDGVYGYFYTGTPEHCNNAAFVLLPAPIKLTGKKCRLVKQGSIRMPSTFVRVEAIHSGGSYVPGVTAVVPGGIQTNSKLVCE